MASRRCLRSEDYTVAWIAALPLELAAAKKMLDEEHHPLPQDSVDPNTYTFGSIGEHNVVMACLPVGKTGNNSAATVATWIKSRFRGLRFGLLVGIGGGVPTNKTDIRLGDVVVSQPNQGTGGVVQYDFGKSTPSGFERTGFLNAPPDILLGALSNYQATNLSPEESLTSHAFNAKHTAGLIPDYPAPDLLFEANYNHVGGDLCEECSRDRLLKPTSHKNRKTMVYYGTIASGNQVIKDARTRDQLSLELGRVLCFEMEAAGIINSFPCLVIRGICDYADSHKQKKWQHYAATTAAAYAKEILLTVPPVQSRNENVNNSEALAPYRSKNVGAILKRSEWDMVDGPFFSSYEHVSDYEPDRTYWEHLRKRCPGTATWIFESEELQSWLSRGRISCIWLTGKIGSGKTVVTSSILKRLIEEYAQNHNPVFHFFYSYAHKSRLMAADLFRSYIKQLLNHLDTYTIAWSRDITTCLLRFFGPKSSPPTFDEIIERIFIPLSNLVPRAVFVIDGLDECETGEALKVLGVFRRLILRGDIRFLVSGRESLDITQSIPSSVKISISERHAKEDVQAFVNWKIAEKMQERQLTENSRLLEEIKTTLIEKADRM